MRNNWLATVRGRVGYAMGATGAWMPYVTGGVAFGDVSNAVSGVGMVSDNKTGWTLGASTKPAGPRAPERRPAIELGVGDDVVHGTFGEGVVTGSEPGVVMVRFASDGTERRLMADYAPLRKAS